MMTDEPRRPGLHSNHDDQGFSARKPPVSQNAWKRDGAFHGPCCALIPLGEPWPAQEVIFSLPHGTWPKHDLSQRNCASLKLGPAPILRRVTRLFAAAAAQKCSNDIVVER